MGSSCDEFTRLFLMKVSKYYNLPLVIHTNLVEYFFKKLFASNYFCTVYFIQVIFHY